MSVESRKIQAVTGGTYTVSLPEDWAVDAGLSAGSVVDLHVQGEGTLVVEPGADADEAFGRVVVECPEDAPRRIEHVIRAAYAAGADEVVLAASSEVSKTDRRAVEATTRTLTGSTVSHETDGRIRVRSLLDSDQVSLRQSVNHLRAVALSTHREATASLSSEAPGARSEGDDAQADRLFAVVDRHFERAIVRLNEVEALGLDRAELLVLWTTARELERVAEHARRIASVSTARDRGLSDDREPSVEELAAAARDVVDDATRFVVEDADVQVAWDALERHDRVIDAVDAQRDELLADADADHRLTCVLDAVARTAEHGCTIAERALGHAVRDGRLAPTEAAHDANVDQGADAD